MRRAYEDARRAYELAEAARTRRLELGLTQTEVARHAGIPQPSLSRIEGGAGTPTIAHVEPPRRGSRDDLCGPIREGTACHTGMKVFTARSGEHHALSRHTQLGHYARWRDGSLNEHRAPARSSR
ncbi:helix-turn-helix domain-containing protein [Nocardia caishijiensis]